MPTVSVVSPCLNERQYLPIWLCNIIPFADEIVIIDGGSSDGSWDYIKGAQSVLPVPIKCIQKRQEGRPYSDDWNEAYYRNWLLENCAMDYVLSLDVDELLSDNFLEFKNNLTEVSYALKFISFWKDFNTVRLDHPNDKRWEGHHLCLWKNDLKLKYVNKHHCILKNFDSRTMAYIDEVSLLHIHYAMGFKYRDNRRADVGYGYSEEVGKPDWNFLENNENPYGNPNQHRIVTKPYTGEYPQVLSNYIKELEN